MTHFFTTDKRLLSIACHIKNSTKKKLRKVNSLPNTRKMPNKNKPNHHQQAAVAAVAAVAAAVNPKTRNKINKK
jgi:hypothetical protein